MSKCIKIESFKVVEQIDNVTYLSKMEDTYLDLADENNARQFNFIMNTSTNKKGMYFNEKINAYFRIVLIDTIPVTLESEVVINENEPENQIQNPENDSEN